MLTDRMPFAVHEVHPDTGNEFINYHMHRWAQKKGYDLTRSEPYKKNDNMCIEERNNSIARKHLGYVRLDDVSLVPLASDILYIACFLHNHFRPVRCMTDKIRIGAKWKRTFEKQSKTPCQRVLERSDISNDIKDALRVAHAALNPLELKRKLDILKAELSKKIDYSRTKKRGTQ